MRIAVLALVALLACASTRLFAADAPWQQLGGATFDNWTGVTIAANGVAFMSIPGEAAFRYPDDPRGYYKHGFRVLNGGTADWLRDWGVQFSVKSPDARELELTV